MSTEYLVTGAAGHLGSCLCRQLAERKAKIKALLLPGESDRSLAGLPGITILRGDLRDAKTREAFLAKADGFRKKLFHLAGKISIQRQIDEALWAVNVTATKALLASAKAAGVGRFLYASSVHALHEDPKLSLIKEQDSFSPEWVQGAYAKSKAAATQAVLDAQSEGFETLVVHPAGLIGPHDHGKGHMTEVLERYAQGKLDTITEGGYAFADPRDVASGMLSAMEEERPERSYILAGPTVEMSEILTLARRFLKRKQKLKVLPLWFLKLLVPFMEAYAKLRREKPLMTSYSLHTLGTRSRFASQKAIEHLGYRMRPLAESVKDALDDLAEQGRIQGLL